MSSLTDDEARDLGRKAFVFGFPLVLMDVTRRRMTNVPAPAGTSGPANRFAHVQRFPDATFEDVVSPNADTLYSSGWLDLADEPLVLRVPDTRGRYYVMPIYDAWTNVYRCPGPRSNGDTAEHIYAICGPRWDGSLPAGLERIDSPTELGWIIGRIEAKGADDFPFVHGLQAGLTLTPLSAWGTDYEPPAGPVDPAIDMQTAPVDTLTEMEPRAFLERFAGLMGANPPSPADAEMVADLERIGVRPGRFDANALDEDGWTAVAHGVEAAQRELSEPPTGELENGWVVIREGIGSYGTDYARRAFVDWIGLGANLPEDAVYPSTRVDGDGEQLNGANRYVLRFGPGEAPPVHGFWSLTMYNMRQFFVDNPLDRYAIGDRDDLRLEGDGSLEIQIQHSEPDEGTANWLPAPPDDFNLMLRMYWPKQAVLDGGWGLPPVRKLD